MGVEPEAKKAVVNQQGNLFDNPDTDDIASPVELLPEDFTNIESVRNNYTIVDTIEAIKELNTKHLKQKSVSIDTETPGVDP